MNQILNLHNGFVHSMQTYVSPFVLMAMRLTMAKTFWLSGLTKIRDWSSTVGLFRDEYQVPFISPEIAAFFATTVELTCPILLTLGLMTRLATIPMLIMTAIIQFTYMSHMNHLYWALLLGTILSFGPGAFSVDVLVKKYFLPPK